MTAHSRAATSPQLRKPEPIRENDWFRDGAGFAWRVFDVRPFGELSLVREDRKRIDLTTKAHLRARTNWTRIGAPEERGK